MISSGLLKTVDEVTIKFSWTGGLVDIKVNLILCNLSGSALLFSFSFLIAFTKSPLSIIRLSK